MNHNRLQKVSSLGENLVISAKSYYSPSRRSSSLTSLQSVLLAPLRLQLFGVQDKKINAMLADERRYYSEDSLAFCQRAYIELDATDSENLALFVADTKRKIESGEIKYSVTGMNCVDFVRQALKSVDNDTDLTAIFDGSIPISVNGENGFSVTGAWALFKEKGFVHLIQKLLAIKLAQAA